MPHSINPKQARAAYPRFVTAGNTGKGYVLGVSAAHRFASWIGKPEVAGTAAQIAHGLDATAWQRLPAGAGTKGPRLYDWAYLELADLPPAAFGGEGAGLWTRGLLIRRTVRDADLAYFSTWCPAGTGIATLVAVAGQRWTIEEGFETAKTELGLDHNETRSWHGWHRHVSLVMLAFAMMATIRHHANNRSLKKKTAAATASTTPSLIRWSIQEIRRIAIRLAQRRIHPAHIIAWSCWRRAHQATAQRSHLKRKMQL